MSAITCSRKIRAAYGSVNEESTCSCRFKLRAAVGVRHDGELTGSRGGDGGRGVAFDRVDVGGRSLADAGASIVSALGLHSDLLRWALSSGLGAVEVGLLMSNAC